MRLDDALKILSEDSLLAVMPPALLTRIARRAKVRHAPRGEAVVRQGQPADKLIIPINSSLRLVEQTAAGAKTAQLGARRALNLREVLVDGTWAYGAFADADLHVLEIDAKLFRDALTEVPQYARYLHRITGMSSVRDAANVLRRAGLHPLAVQMLFSEVEERTLEAEQVIATPEWVLVESGMLALSRDEHGERVQLTTIIPGEFYGGSAALGHTIPLPMRAIESTKVLAIDGTALAKLCAFDPNLARVLRNEHPGVQRRVRQAFIESGQEFTNAVSNRARQVIDDDDDFEPTRHPIADTPPLGREWKPSAGRTRRLDGFRCTNVEDTSAAALASLLKFHGRSVSLSSVRRALMRRSPPSLLDLAKVGERQGLMSHAAKVAGPRDLTHLRAPFLLLVGDHFVVVHEVTRSAVRVFDPLGGLRQLSMKLLERSWSGLTLSFPDVRPILASLNPPHQKDGKPGEQRPPDKRGMLSRLSPYFRLFADVRGALFAASMLSVTVLALSILSPRLNGLIIDNALAYGDLGLLGIVAIGMILIHLSMSALSSFRSVCVNYLGGVMEYRLSALTLRHTLGVSLDAHGEARVGTALARLGELGRIRQSLSTDIISTVLDVIQGFVFLVLVFVYGAKLGLIVLIAIPLSVLLVRLGGRRYRALYAELFDENRASQSEITEQIEQISTIKALGAGAASQRRWEKALVARVNTDRRILRSSLWISNSLGLVQEGVRIGGMYLGIKLVLGGELSAGAMFAVTQYTLGALSPIVSLASKLDEMQQLGASLSRIDELFVHPIEDDEIMGVRSDAAFEGSIRVRDLEFSYPNGPPILKNISFEIEPGQTIAIVGRSGSGKTTLAKILHGAFRPTGGELWFDDQDGTTLPLPVIRRNVGMVLQESQLFAGSILENIAYGDDRHDESKAKEVARLAAAHDFISAFPRRYETHLAEGGLGLSGGQRQRICIARALYQTPPILVMDEATSSLDAESERAIMANMRDILRGRTAIVIAHRLHTVKHAHKILVIDQGEIVEVGNHDELIAQRGLYHKLFGQQLQQN